MFSKASKSGVRWSPRAYIAAAALILSAGISSFSWSRADLPLTPPQPATAQAAQGASPGVGKLPLQFEPNAGQTDPTVRFLAHAPGGILFFTRSGVTLSLPSGSDRAVGATGNGTSNSVVVTQRFAGANRGATIESTAQLPGKVSYIAGNDPSAWHTGLPTYEGIIYKSIYPGIDLKYTGAGGKLKSTYTVQPGADPSVVQWAYEGASPKVDGAGNLSIISGTSGHDLSEQAPVAWQEIEGSRVTVAVSFHLSSDGRVGFSLGNYDSAYPLVIDPTLTYSSYLGGNYGDKSRGVAFDTQGNMYIAGETNSTSFPLANAYQSALSGTLDAFVSKLNAAGNTLLYSTYLGGTGREGAQKIGVDSAGNAYVTGWTNSADFPTANAFQPAYGGGQFDGWVAKFSAAGTALLYSTYLGGRYYDQAHSLVVDANGYAYVTGETNSDNFPLVNPYQSTDVGTATFISKFNPTGSALVYSTFLGGSGGDYGWDIAIDSTGAAYVTGQTYSNNFPVSQGAVQTTRHGTQDSFVSKLNPAGNTLGYSTYLGGASTEWGYGIGVDDQGEAVATGYTISGDFPTYNPYQPALHGGFDAYVTKLNTTATGFIYSTYLGGANSETGYSVATDALGNAYIAGGTGSGDFPTVNPVQPNYGGASSDAFVTKFNPTGSALLYSTFLGGNGLDVAYNIKTDATGNAYVTGESGGNFPVVNAYQPTNGGGSDAFVSRIYEPLPTATPTETPCAGCGTPTYTATATSTNTPTRTPTATSTNTPTPTNTPGTPQANTPTPTNTRRATYTPAPTFTPPATNTATATNTPGGPTPIPCAITFSDVQPSEYFYQAVSYLYCARAISGYGDNTFRPFNNTTRSQLVKIVVLAENWPLIVPPEPTFADVPADNPFYQYVETAVQHQIISGYADGNFHPYNNVTRGQLCKIISIAERWPLIDPVDPHFTDVNVENPFYVFVETAYSHSVISGYSDGTFRWANNATRGQLCKIIYTAITQH